MESKRTSLINQVNELARRDRNKALKKYQGNKEDYLAKARAFYDELEERGINTSADKVESINMFVPYILSPIENRKLAHQGSKLWRWVWIAGCIILLVIYTVGRRLF
jgi:hypothetical protein